MNIVANFSLVDLVGALLGFLFTLFVFSYLFGDNALFRLTIHVFIGVAAAYAAVIAWDNVLWPQLVLPLVSGNRSENLLLVFPLVLSGLLITKVSPRLAALGNPAAAYLVGIGVATAIGGAVLGTMFPQVGAAVDTFDLDVARESSQNILAYLANGSIILVGTLTTLIYFQFGARKSLDNHAHRGGFLEGLAWIGQLFIAVTFGALFSGVYAAALTALIERIRFLIDLFLPFLVQR